MSVEEVLLLLPPLISGGCVLQQFRLVQLGLNFAPSSVAIRWLRFISFWNCRKLPLDFLFLSYVQRLILQFDGLPVSSDISYTFQMSTVLNNNPSLFGCLQETVGK